MFSHLNIKFAALLLLVAGVALSASLIFRALIINEFKSFREGEMEDRVYWIVADIEGTFEKYHGWNRSAIAEDTVWHLLLGIETRVFNVEGKLMMDSAMALDSLPALSKLRVQAASGISQGKRVEGYVPYPLFLAGKEIGRLEVHFLPYGKEELFIRRTNWFLLVSSLLTGGLALVLSIIFTRKLTGPIERLASAAEAVSLGDMKTRVDVSGKDEIARLSLAIRPAPMPVGVSALGLSHDRSAKTQENNENQHPFHDQPLSQRGNLNPLGGHQHPHPP